MAGRIITVAQQKGGSGKTTLAVNLAVTLRGRGFSVALLELNVDASLSTSVKTILWLLLAMSPEPPVWVRDVAQAADGAGGAVNGAQFMLTLPMPAMSPDVVVV